MTASVQRLVDSILRRCAPLALVCSLVAAPVLAQTLPQGGKVTAGGAMIGKASAKGLNVQQSSNRAVIDWNSFSIGRGETVNFALPGATSATLNRVTGSMTSVIAGALHSNGELYLINPNGIEITATGVINTRSLTASALAISDIDFLSGRNLFTGNGNSAAVTNQGLISVAPAGAVLLLGGTVTNAGSIIAPRGKVGLGAGESVSVDLEGDRFLTVSVPSANVPLLQALITQSGHIQARGGQVSLRAATTADVARAAIRVSGELDAGNVTQSADGVDFGLLSALVTDGGTVSVAGGSGGSVEVTAQLNASSAAGTGGSISVTGRHVSLSGAALDASGASSGGTILIGGDLHGQGALPVALTTVVDGGVTLRADATGTGKGGSIIVWSEGSTTDAGQISARGGTQGGNGGQVEVSSHDLLNFTGLADLRAPHGQTGTLLLDPYNVTIRTGAGAPADTCTAGTCTPSGSNSILAVAALQTALGSSNVSVTTGASGADAGNITVANAVTWASAYGLTLSAANNINVNASVTATGSGALALTAAGGTVSVTNATLSTNGGNLTLSAPASGASTALTLNNATISVGNGTGTLSGTSATAFGIQFLGTSTLTATGAGSLTLTGTHSVSGASDNGIEFSGGATVTTSGTVTLTGSGSGAANASNGVRFTGTSGLVDSSGNLTVTGTGASAGSGVWFNGVTTLTNGGAGSFSMTGSNSNANGFGIALGNGTQSLTTSGPISLSGTESSSGYGIRFVNASTITDSSGNLTMSGTSNSGVGIQFSTTNALANSGAGSFALTGTSTTAGGIQFFGTSTLTDAGAGSLTLTGTHSGSGNSDGIEFLGGATATTSGTVTLSGSGSGAGNFSNGVHFAGTSGLVDSSGNLTVTGVGANAGSGVWFSGVTTLTNSGAGSFSMSGSNSNANGFGMALGNGTQSLTTSGPISLSGTESSSGIGINFVTTNTITDSSGNLTMTGSSNSGVGTQFGTTSNTLANSGAGSFTLTGTSTSSVGMLIRGASTLTNSSTGTLSVSGTSSGSVGGLQLAASATLSTSGPVSLSGTSSTGTGVDFQGPNTVTDNSGNTTLSGSSGSNTGIYFSGSDSINNNGAGSLVMTATSAGYRAWELNTGASLATSGNITANATTSTGTGVYMDGTDTLSVSSGTLSLNGTATTSGRGANLLGSNTLTNSGSGVLNISGTSSSGIGTKAVGNSSLTTSGSVTFTGTSNSGNGVFIQGANSLTVSNGTLSVNGSSTSAVGVDISGANSFSNGGGALTITGTSGSGNGVQVETSSSVTTTGNMSIAGASSGGYGFKISAGDSVTASSGNLTLSGSSSSSFGQELMAAGSITNNGTGTLTLSTVGGIDLNASITSTSGPAVITGSGNITQSAGTIAVNNLLLSGASGNFTLNASGNQIGTVAANAASLIVNDQSALTTGNVSGTAGVTTSGGVTLTTASNLTIASGAPVSGTSPVLGATGAFINNAGSGAVTATTGRWLIYSNAPSSDTFGSLNSGNAAIWNATYTSLPPSSVTGAGNFYLFAFQPTLTFSTTNASKTYGVDDTSSIAGNYTIAGMQSGIASAFLSDSAASVYSGTPTAVTSAGSAPTATVTGGPYAMTIGQGSVTSLDRYALSLPNTGLLTVNPATLTVTATNQSKVYGTTLALGSTAFTDTGLLNSDTLTAVTLTSPGSVATATVAGGPYAITPSSAVGTGLSNYTIGYLNGALMVNPASLTVTATNQSKVYGSTLALGNTAFTDTGLLNSDTLTSATLTSPGTVATATVAGGSYAITPSNAVGMGLSNYTIGYVNGALTVNPATLTVTASNQSKVYGSTLALGNTAFTDTGLLNSDTLTGANLTSPGSVTTATVAGGPYAITPSNAVGSGLSNYSISYANGSLTVNPATLTVTASNQSKTYGTTYALGSTAFTASGLVNSDTLTSATLTSTGTVATATVAGGPYAITPSNAVGSGLSNYSINYANGSLTVNPATLTVTASNQSKVYGSTLALGNTAFTDTGLLNSDTLTGANLTSLGAAATATVAGGPYVITPSNAAGSGLSNYSIGYVNGALAVTPATLLGVVTAANKVYDGSTTATLTSETLSGAIYNADASNLKLSVGAANFNSKDVPTANTVTATDLTLSGSAASNYELISSAATASASITPRPLTISANPENQLFGHPTPPLTYTVGGLGLVNGDHLAGALSIPPDASAAVGSYPITQGTLAVSSDYALSYAGATLMVLSPGWPMSAELAARTYVNDLKVSAVSGEFDDPAGTVYVDRSATCMDAAGRAAQTGTAPGVLDPAAVLRAQAYCAGAWAHAGERIDWWAIEAGRSAMAVPPP